MKTKSSQTSLTHDEISHRAHALWLARGSPAGSAMNDWLEAERQLAHERRARSHSQPGAIGAADEIDEEQLGRRLDDFGEPETRSYTSLD